MKSLLRQTCVLGAGLLALASGQAQTPQAQAICDCWVTSLSADGTAAAGNLDGSYGVFRWTLQGGLQALAGKRNPSTVLGVTAGIPRISDNGKVVAATITDSTNTFATQGRWVEGKGWQQLDHPLPPGGGVMDQTDSSVFGLSADGEVVTGLYWLPATGAGIASAWTPATGMTAAATSGSASRIDGASRDGRVLAGWQSDATTGVWQAAVWVQGQPTILDTSGNWSEAAAVNRVGTIVVGQDLDPSTGISSATLWQWGASGWTSTSLGVPAGTKSSGSSYANAVSDDGTVVGGSYAKVWGPRQEAFIWTPASGSVDLAKWLAGQGLTFNPKKIKLIDVEGISADGHTLAVVAQEQVPPYRTRSLLIKY